MEKPMMPMFDRHAFRALSGQAQQDYRQQFGADMRNWVQALTGRTPAAPGATPATPATPPAPVIQQPYVAPPLPQGPGGVGSSYIVPGMTPATSGFKLPVY